MKKYLLLASLLVLFSCGENGLFNNKDDDNPTPPQVSSSIRQLDYPSGTGFMGEEKTGLLGYGYDIRGFCDTISVRAKVIDMTLASESEVIIARPLAAYSTITCGVSFHDLCFNFTNYYKTSQDSLVLVNHLKSLTSLAFGRKSEKQGYAYVYYSLNAVMQHYKYFFTVNTLNEVTTAGFRSDALTLTAAELVEKYGSHVLTDFFYGTRLEVLYCGSYQQQPSQEEMERNFFNRMSQFSGSVPGILSLEGSAGTPIDEYLIYNTTGSKTKLCHLVRATDNNPDDIYIDPAAPFGENMQTGFTQVGEKGLLPLYQCVADPVKSAEIKSFMKANNLL